MFRETTYQAFTYLNHEFLDIIYKMTNISDLKPRYWLTWWWCSFEST